MKPKSPPPPKTLTPYPTERDALKAAKSALRRCSLDTWCLAIRTFPVKDGYGASIVLDQAPNTVPPADRPHLTPFLMIFEPTVRETSYLPGKPHLRSEQYRTQPVGELVYKAPWITETEPSPTVQPSVTEANPSQTPVAPNPPPTFKPPWE